MPLDSSKLKPYQNQYYREAIEKATSNLNEDQKHEFVNELNIFGRTGKYSGAAGKSVAEVLKKIPQNQQDLNKYIIENTANLESQTPETLTHRLEALSGQTQPQTAGGVNLEGFKNFIEGQINKEIFATNTANQGTYDTRYSVLSSANVPALADQLARAIFANPGIDISQVISDPSIAGELARPFASAREQYKTALSNAQTEAERQSTILSSETQKQIQDTKDALTSLNNRNAANAQVDSFVNSLPAELARSREQFLTTAQQQAGQEFTQNIAPDIAQTLNARGILFSGDLPSELARGAAAAYSSVQQAAIDLQNQDDAFFQNAGYQNALRQEIEAGRQVTNQIYTGRQNALGNQQMNFERTQADLRRQFDEQSASRNYQRSYIQQQQQLERQRQEQRTQQQDQLYQQVGSVAGQIIGAYAGSRIRARPSTSGVTS